MEIPNRVMKDTTPQKLPRPQIPEKCGLFVAPKVAGAKLRQRLNYRLAIFWAMYSSSLRSSSSDLLSKRRSLFR